MRCLERAWAGVLLAAALAASVTVAAAQESTSTPASAAEKPALVVEGEGGRHTFQVEIADDQEEHARGLMFRRSMDRTAGMLFDFGDDKSVWFWMKNTYLPLDMLFIGEDRRVKYIARNTTPLSERTITPPEKVRYVLEINAGVSAALGINIGDAVSGPAVETP